MRLINRRFDGRLLFLAVVIVATYGLSYVPGLHFDVKRREEIRALCNVAAYLWARVWVQAFSLKAIPPEQRDRIEDVDLHVSMGANAPQWCARCSDGRPVRDWVPWADCKYRKKAAPDA